MNSRGKILQIRIPQQEKKYNKVMSTKRYNEWLRKMNENSWAKEMF